MRGWHPITVKPRFTVWGRRSPLRSEAVLQAEVRAGAPRVLVARTVFGHGVSFMESQVKWHYMPMSQADYDDAMNDIKSLR